MIKNWKNLFVRSEEEEPDSQKPAPESFSFPVSTNNTSSDSITTPKSQANETTTVYTPQAISDPVHNEVMQVYEKGLDSINMPGYDFYEFYKAITSTGQSGEHMYTMAYQMAKTLDKTITPQKLMADAEFYVSKINEVHSQYVTQGQKRLNALQEQKHSERNKLQSEIDQASMRISQLRTELQQLETDVDKKRGELSKTDESYSPQEKTIKEKLSANDMARKTSIEKLNTVKEGIQRFIKN